MVSAVRATPKKTPSRPKRQHTVPAMLLRNFTGLDGKLHCFDLLRDRAYELSPENAFVESHAYTFRSPTKADSYRVESALAVLEGHAKGVIDQIVDCARAGSVPRLSNGGKDVLDEFVLLQFRRSAAARRRALEANDRERFLDEAIVAAEAAFPERDVRAALAALDADQLLTNSWIVSLTYEAPDWLATKGLAVVHSPHGGDRLLIGSNPVLLAGADRRKPDGEVLLPIASDVAISLAGSRGEERLITDKGGKLIRMTNAHVFRQSDVVAAAMPSVLVGLIGAFRKRNRRAASARP